MTLYVIVYKNQCQFIRMSWIYCASLGWFPKAPKRHEPQTFVTAVLTHEIPRAPSGLGWPPVATEAVDQCLPHSSSKSHRGEGHVSTGGGSAQICVDKTKDTPRKIGNAKLVGMISASWFCNAAQGCVGVCKWIRTQQWIKLSKGSLPRKDIGSGWWFIVIQPDILQVFNQLFITVCRNGYLLIETNSQEITFCQWSFLYSQQLHR